VIGLWLAIERIMAMVCLAVVSLSLLIILLLKAIDGRATTLLASGIKVGDMLVDCVSYLGTQQGTGMEQHSNAHQLLNKRFGL
jgi:hypothetical protein